MNLTTILNTIKGWKTLGVSMLVVLIGLFQFTFDIMSPIQCALALVVAGVVFFVLRMNTTTPVGGK